jgi:hypothetical protein
MKTTYEPGDKVWFIYTDFGRKQCTYCEGQGKLEARNGLFVHCNTCAGSGLTWDNTVTSRVSKKACVIEAATLVKRLKVDNKVTYMVRTSKTTTQNFKTGDLFRLKDQAECECERRNTYADNIS